jgi:hypothetical protein
MNGCRLILKLPESLLRSVLVEWLEVRSVARMDSAFCIQNTRQEFVLLAYNHGNAFALGITHAVNACITRWCTLRGARVDDVRLKSYLGGSVCERFLISQGAHLRKVAIRGHTDGNDSRPTLSAIAKHCSSIQELKVETARMGLYWDIQLCEFTTACPNVLSLDLTNVILTTHGLRDALLHCTCLERLTIKGRASPLPVEVALPSLVHLDAESIAGIADPVLIAIGSNCRRLQTLRAFDTYELYFLPCGRPETTDVGVRAVFEGCPLLSNTDIVDAPNLSAGLRAELRAERAKRKANKVL